MPAAYVADLVKQGKGSKAALEKKWKRAKKIAADSGHAEEYDYIMGIFKKMIGEHDQSLTDRLMSFNDYLREAVEGTD